MNFRKRLIAAAPFISLLLFFIIWFVVGKFKYAWLAFLLIPLMPILVGYQRIKFTFSLFITVIYLIIGFAYGVWHPGWIIFLLIPIYHILFPKSIYCKKKIVKTTIHYKSGNIIDEDDYK